MSEPETIPPWDVIREQRRAVRAEAGRFGKLGLSLHPEETQILYADDDLEHLRPRRTDANTNDEMRTRGQCREREDK